MSSTVYELQEMVAHRLPGKVNLYPAINNAIRLIADHLFTRRSRMIVSELSVKFVTGEASASLPSDFWGLVEYPHQYSKTYQLKPLPSREIGLNNENEGIPEYFEIKDDTIYVYPMAGAAWTLIAEDLSFELASGHVHSVAGELDDSGYLAEGVYVTVEDSTSNDATLTVSSTATTTLIMSVDDTLVDESAGEEITLSAGPIIEGDYYAKPTKLTTLTDSIPFNEEFDWAIAEATIMMHTQGNVQAFIIDQVNKKLPYRDLRAQSRVMDIKKWHRRW